ncbi:hypothetical protein [Achromobacter animicus]|uniref:hypothetical protein n=1 Tax=Achromobacter animicus TaxID=1389935 RepID=UPI0028A63368|nr:hypothetical protein [Achromobacter animicus]
MTAIPAAVEAQPVCWIDRTQLESVRDEGDDAWVYWRETGHEAEPDEVPLYAAPQASAKAARLATADSLNVRLLALRDAIADVFNVALGRRGTSASVANPLATRVESPAIAEERGLSHTRMRPAAAGKDWKAIGAAIDEYLDGYELRLDEGCHTPSKFERFLIDDAIAGILAEEEILALLCGPAPAARVALELKRKADLIAELSNIIHDMTVAQQAAWIEWQHGAGADAAMQWIENGLAGPGHIPDGAEPYGKEAQAWYDANKADPFPACYCGRPSNILHMGNGYCSTEHYNAATAYEQVKGAGDA